MCFGTLVHLLVVLSPKLCPFLLRIQLSHLILVFIRFLLSHKLGTVDAVPVLRLRHGLPLICCFILDPAGFLGAQRLR